MSDDLRRLMAQHAKTSELLGVDFLPLGKPVRVADDQPSQEPSDPSDIRFAVSSPSTTRSTRSAPPPPPLESPPEFEPQTPQIKPIDWERLRACYEHLDDPSARLEALCRQYELDAPHKAFNTRFTNIVFGEGSPIADLMFVGEAPGEQEDLSGRPFVGRAGQLLDKMIGAMGFDRQSVYIANVLKTRPPNNATPTMRESLLCAPYLLEQIRIIQPRVIVTLGLPATHLLTGTTSPMRSLRGQWRLFEPDAIGDGAFSGYEPDPMGEIELMPTYHPAYLLRSYTQDNRRKVWSDLTQVIEKLAPGGTQ